MEKKGLIGVAGDGDGDDFPQGDGLPDLIAKARPPICSLGAVVAFVVRPAH